MTSSYQRHICLHCRDNYLAWDCESEEWSCPHCSRRFQPAWIDRQGAMTRMGGPVEARLPPVDAIEAAEEACECRGRCLVPGLRPLRKALHMTLDDFATACGTTRSVVCKWESGETAPSCAMLITIVTRCGISFEALTKCAELETKRAPC